LPALDVLATAVGEGAASVLTSRLQLEETTATDVWSSLNANRSAGLLSFGF
jgi:hypothetical protein